MNIVSVSLIVIFIMLSCYGIGYQIGKDKAIAENVNIELLKQH